MIEIPIIVGSLIGIFLVRELCKKRNHDINNSDNLIVFIDGYGQIVRVNRTITNRINTIESINKYTETYICDDNITCAITQENIPIGVEVRRLPCNHNFTKSEIDIWLQQNNNRPICREDVILPPV